MKQKKSIMKNCLKGLLFGALIIFCLMIGIRSSIGFGYYMGFNIGTDPYGAFGDQRLQWWSYDMTKNPKVAKFQYLKQHHEEFDSYIIGCSETSGYPIKELNECFDARFYNLAMYDADMFEYEQYCRYLIAHYDVKNIVLNVHLENGRGYHMTNESLAELMPYQVSGGSMFEYYKGYLLANPKYGEKKLECDSKDTYLRQAFDVFDEKTGAYDTRKEDAERIGDALSYIKAHPEFKQEMKGGCELPEIDRCMKSVGAIREMCEANGVKLTVIAAPLYQDYVDCFAIEDVGEFYSKLADVTPYWNFSLSTISQDSRYFYDKTHFRNSVGKMALARIADAKSVYIPEDFGVYVNESDRSDKGILSWKENRLQENLYTKKVPILMYHHLVEGKKTDHWDVMTVSQFKKQIKALSQAGYTAVTFDDLRRYVYEGVDLPAKPVVITFDDGYYSNYELAVPILKEFNMKATVFVIGVSMGKDFYKDTGISMAPHFGWEEARKMEASGVIDIESHGYDIHEVPGCDKAPIREGCLPRNDETEDEYVAFLSDDCERMQALFRDQLDKKASVLAYPYGNYSELSEVIVAQEGFDITLSVEAGNNIIVKGLPQSLKAMKRHFIKEETTPQALLAMIQS